jgi:transposase, IS5 family
MGAQGGRRPFLLGTMLRIYCLQQWYNLSDPGAEEALYDIQSMRKRPTNDLSASDLFPLDDR